MQLKYLYNKITQKLGIGLILMIIISIHIFIIIGNSFLVKYSINETENDAIIINKSGKIRGGIQRVVKLELENQNTEKDIANIDSIFNEFLIEGKYKMLSYEMDNFVSKLLVIRKEWNTLKELIQIYHTEKNSENRNELIEQSEYIWTLSEDALLTVSKISLQKTYMLNNTFIIFLIDFILIIFVIYIIDKKVRKKLEILSSIDSLTNTKNRNKYNESLKFELELNKKYKTNTAYIILDIDNFKKINDTFGHDVGDMVLKELVIIVEETIRKGDILFRIGGEEFAILVKEIDKENLEKFASKIRKKVEDFDSKIGYKFTISIGATMFEVNDTKDTIFKRADEALYKSKNGGRNKVTIV